jgi:competence protein ComFC
MKDFLGYKDSFLALKKRYNLLRFFSPTPCMICGEIDSVDEGPFCKECYREFVALFNNPCPLCGGDREECECFAIKGTKGISFLFWYDNELSKKVLLTAKYKGDERYISYFGELIAKNIKSQFNKVSFDGVCFVPRSKENINSRGFDQSKILAESISYHLNVPVLKALVRSGKSEEQKKLSGQERRKNVKNKFVVDYYGLANSDGVIPSQILLIDDVITTGSTILECSYLLRKAGVRNIYVASIAKTPLKRNKKKRYRRKK